MIGYIMLSVAVLVFILAIYSCIVAAGKADEVIEKCWHNCHYKKHYDHKKKCYVYRCPKCGKENDKVVGNLLYTRPKHTGQVKPMPKDDFTTTDWF